MTFNRSPIKLKFGAKLKSTPPVLSCMPNSRVTISEEVGNRETQMFRAATNYHYGQICSLSPHSGNTMHPSP